MRWVAYGLALLIVATLAVLAALLPENWSATDRVMLVGMGLLIAAGLHLMARPRLVAGEDSVTVVNSIRTHVLSWAEIVDIRMPVGEPWPSVDLSDGTTLAVMGIQSADGETARRGVEEFRDLLRERGEAQEPDRP
nr:PH domain-containing protein [Nocardiopsis algeriensis]